MVPKFRKAIPLIANSGPPLLKQLSGSSVPLKHHLLLPERYERDFLDSYGSYEQNLGI